jgi:type I restriction enzyme S subunit
MNPERLLQHFDQIAEAPDAVPRLRRFILDLAVRGKLVEQNPNDEPASELLKRIGAEKVRLIKLGEIRKEKPLQLIDKKSVPFKLPPSWQWVPIRKIAADRGQKIPDKKFSYIDVSAIDKERGKIAKPQVLTPEAAPSRARKIAQKGDVIYSCVRPYLLNIAVVDENFRPEPIVSTAFAVLNGFGMVEPRYLWIVLRSPFFVICVEEKMRGQAYPAINDRDFAPLPFPIPPLAEQHRIVAKVDQLMALCDELEAAQTKREKRRNRLVAATLHGLNNGDGSAEPGIRPTFEESARFYFNQLPRLTTRPKHIHQLRQTILNFAVRGKLVPQDPEDEPTSELLKRIEEEKTQLPEGGKFPRTNRKPVKNKKEFPYELPSNWKWCQLAELSLKIHYGYTASAKAALQEVRLLRITDIQNNSVHWESVPGCEIEKDRADQYLLADGDILIARTGGTIGKSFLVKDIPVKAVFASYLIRVQGTRKLFDRYLKLFFESPVYWRQMDEGSRGTGQPNVNGQTLGNMAVPLPPLTEQHRIVAKVDELMALCNELESRLATTATTRRQLLDAALYEALNLHSGIQ